MDGYRVIEKDGQHSLVFTQEIVVPAYMPEPTGARAEGSQTIVLTQNVNWYLKLMEQIIREEARAGQPITEYLQEYVKGSLMKHLGVTTFPVELTPEVLAGATPNPVPVQVADASTAKQRE